MKHSPFRRRAVSWIGMLAAIPLLPTPALGDDMPATPEVDEGPFYPQRMPADTDADLTRIEGHAGVARGTPLDVSGRLLDRHGAPRVGSRVEIWQCDATGHYHHVRERDATLDPDFQGFGAVLTDVEGRYAFRTIRPVAYPGRTPHIHVAIVEAQRRRLTTQLFVEGEPGNARDGLYRHLGPDAARVTMKLVERQGALTGTVDLVL